MFITINKYYVFDYDYIYLNSHTCHNWRHHLGSASEVEAPQDQRDKKGCSPLMLAAMNGSFEVGKMSGFMGCGDRITARMV